MLLPYLEELTSADRVARMANKVADLLDIQDLTSQGKIEGHPAYHPRIMLKILIHAYVQKTSPKEGTQNCRGRYVRETAEGLAS